MLKQVGIISSSYGQSGVPMILQSSGTIGNNGALSAITALPQTYSGGCYMYFPANAIAAGSAAGMYFVIMSSATAGTIYNNLYSSGTPIIPVTPTPFVTTGPGAYAQTTGVAIPLVSIPVPGGSMGLNGIVECHSYIANIGNTNAKTMTLSFGGQAFQSVAQATAANISAEWESIIQNRGSLTTQVCGPLAAPGFGPNTGANVVLNVNTAVTQNVVMSGQLAVATDWTMLDSLGVSS